MCDENGDFIDFFGWDDIAMAGFLAEEMADEERERMLLELEMEKDKRDGID